MYVCIFNAWVSISRWSLQQFHGTNIVLPNINFYRLFIVHFPRYTHLAQFQLVSANAEAIVWPLYFICLGPCFSYANKTDFMIIATKTSINVIYAAKSSKSNLSSSGLGAVEFIGIPESQILHSWMWSPDFIFQNCSVLLECLPDDFMSGNIPKESQHKQRVHIISKSI